MKSTIEIKTAFEGCAEVCELFQLNYNNQCAHIYRCEKIAKVINKLSEQTADNLLDDLFADSMEKLNGLGVEE